MTDMSMFRTKSNQGKQITERVPKFISIIYQMIEDPRYQDYVSWSTDGCAMLIKKPTEFAEYVLPIFFKHNNFSSFVRQLNLYSFRKKKHYPFDNAFVHGMFKRGQKGLLKYIKRKGSDKFSLTSQDSTVTPFYGQEEDTNYEDLIKQNSYLKKVHQDLSEHVQNVEKNIVDLTQQNGYLQSKYERKKQNEDLLKKIVKRLSVIYGDEVIKSVFHSVVQEGRPTKESNFYGAEEIEEIPTKLQLEKPCSNATRSSSYTNDTSAVTESFADNNNKFEINYFDEKFETENSVPTNEITNEKSEFEDLTVTLAPKKICTNFSNWSFDKNGGLKHYFEPQEIHFDGNFNLFENNFN